MTEPSKSSVSLGQSSSEHLSYALPQLNFCPTTSTSRDVTKKYGAVAPAGEEGDFRLANLTSVGPGADAGILEVFHAGAWGTLCTGRFGLSAVSILTLVKLNIGLRNS